MNICMFFYQVNFKFELFWVINYVSNVAHAPYFSVSMQPFNASLINCNLLLGLSLGYCYSKIF
jgi:hypothetical protein